MQRIISLEPSSFQPPLAAIGGCVNVPETDNSAFLGLASLAGNAAATVTEQQSNFYRSFVTSVDVLEANGQIIFVPHNRQVFVPPILAPSPVLSRIPFINRLFDAGVTRQTGVGQGLTP